MMSNDLVERVALAMAFCASDGADPCEEVCGWCLHRARPVVAIVLEEAAKVADEFESDADPDAGIAIAAAIRALVKEQK